MEKNKERNVFKQFLVLCMIVLICVPFLPTNVFADTDLLKNPTVSLRSIENTPFEAAVTLSPDDEFYLYYDYGDIAKDLIDPSKEYEIPLISQYLQFALDAGSEPLVFELTFEGTTKPLGTLRYYKNTSKMIFQFDNTLENQGIDNFYLKFKVKLNGDKTSEGNSYVIKTDIPTPDGEVTITIVDSEKTVPTITKAGPTSKDGVVTGFDEKTNEITWTVKINHGDNPHLSLKIQDIYDGNQSYVEGSLTVNVVPGNTTTKPIPTVDSAQRKITFDLTGIVKKQVTTITYKTTINGASFLDNSGLPLREGQIKCTNKVQALLPGGMVSTTDIKEATYNHPICWLAKTSGNIVDRSTGEMEWTIKIYNNGLNLKNVVLYDRLSPGVIIKPNTAKIKIGKGTWTNLDNFTRQYTEDQKYNNDDSRKYNLKYEMPNVINAYTEIKYNTIIKNITEYKKYSAEAISPPNSIYDNKAFIAYKLESSAGLTTEISTPVVEKEAYIDSGMLGKNGTIETGYHTIKWDIRVNSSSTDLKNAVLSDTMTPKNESEKLYEHFYDDALERNRPTYAYNGVTGSFTKYDSSNPDKAFTYELKTGSTGKVTNIIFRLGDIDKEVNITFRSTVADPEIFAKLSKGHFFENKVVVESDSWIPGFAEATVNYNSVMLEKSIAVDYYNTYITAFDYKNNEFCWIIAANQNLMELKDICITDTLPEGLTLIPGSIRVGSQITGHNYYDTTLDMALTEGGTTRPYYTYDEAAREIKIYLEDITGSQVGTNAARRNIYFYTKIDHDVMIKNKTPNHGENWWLKNIAKLETNYFKGADAEVKAVEKNIPFQFLKKTGTPFLDGGNYSIDYNLAINRSQIDLPADAKVKDTLPVGLRINPDSVKLYEAVFHTIGSYEAPPGTWGAELEERNKLGTLSPGTEIDPSLYSFSCEAKENGTTEFVVNLPPNSSKKAYVLEYSCEVIDSTRGSYDNMASLEGVTGATGSVSITRAKLIAAAGGGRLRNKIKTNAVLEKKDEQTNAAIKDAEFGLYYKGKLIEIKKTDVNGKITWTNIDVGSTYTVKELKAAAGYLEPLNMTADFKATEAPNIVTLAFTNVKKEGSLQFIKVDDTGNALGGAVFGLWTSEADVGTAATVKTAVSDSHGIVLFTGLTHGTYYIKEISAPAGFEGNNDVLVGVMKVDGTQEKLYVQGDASQTNISRVVNTAKVTPPPVVTPVTPPTDDKTLGNLTISKTVTGDGADLNKYFEFVLTLDDISIEGKYGDIVFTAGKSVFALNHGKSINIIGLPVGTKYTISEKDYERWTCHSVNAQGTIAEGTVNAAFDNEYSRAEGNLNVVKEANVSSTRPGGTVKYTLIVSNTGKQPLSNVYIKDYVPQYTTLNQIKDSIGCYTIENGRDVVFWSIKELNPGERLKLSFEVLVDTCLPDNCKINNVAMYSVNEDTRSALDEDIDEKTNPVVTEVKDKNLFPKTGDSNSLLFWTTLMAASVISIIIVAYKYKRKK